MKEIGLVKLPGCISLGMDNLEVLTLIRIFFGSKIQDNICVLIRKFMKEIGLAKLP